MSITPFLLALLPEDICPLITAYVLPIDGVITKYFSTKDQTLNLSLVLKDEKGQKHYFCVRNGTLCKFIFNSPGLPGPAVTCSSSLKTREGQALVGKWQSLYYLRAISEIIHTAVNSSFLFFLMRNDEIVRFGLEREDICTVKLEKKPPPEVPAWTYKYGYHDAASYDFLGMTVDETNVYCISAKYLISFKIFSGQIVQMKDVPVECRDAKFMLNYQNDRLYVVAIKGGNIRVIEYDPETLEMHNFHTVSSFAVASPHDGEEPDLAVVGNGYLYTICCRDGAKVTSEKEEVKVYKLETGELVCARPLALNPSGKLNLPYKLQLLGYELAVHCRNSSCLPSERDLFRIYS